MAKSAFLPRFSLLSIRPKPIMASSSIVSFSPFLRFKLLSTSRTLVSVPSSSSKLHFFSTTSHSRRYVIFVNRPTEESPAPRHRRRSPPRISDPQSDNSPESGPSVHSSSQSGFEGWVDRKLSMDKLKSKYYNERRKSGEVEKDGIADCRDDKGLVFHVEGKDEKCVVSVKDEKVDISEKKKVEVSSKCLKKVPNKDVEASDGEPYIVSRGHLPPTWDGPSGTVVFVNKPKGWTSFTVCGKLRGLVKVKKELLILWQLVY